MNSTSTLILHPTDATLTAVNWKICQQNSCRPSKSDLLSELVDPAEECHMTLEPDDDETIALKQLKRRKNSHRRQGSDLTEATEALSMALDYGDIDLSFLDESMHHFQEHDDEPKEVNVHPAEEPLDDDVSLLEDDADYSCLDDVFRVVLDYPCSDEEEDELMPLICAR